MRTAIPRHPADRERLYTIASAFAFLALTALCYGGGLHASYFGDDFQYLVGGVASNPFWFFAHANPLHTYAYRPIEFAVLWYVQQVAGTDTTLLHFLQFGLHTWIALLVLRYCRGLGGSRIVSFATSFLFLVSQASVHAVASNDTVSQQLMTLFGIAAIWRLHCWILAPERKLGLFLAIVLFALSVFSKELALGYSAVVFALLAHAKLSGRITFRSALLALLPFFLVAVGYLMVRRGLSLPTGHFGSGTYDFHLGLNIPRNLGLLAAQATMPGASSTAFLAAKAHRFSELVLPGLGATLALALAILGFAWSRDWERVPLAACLFAAPVLVALPMNHVSELYVYSALPFFCWFLAYGCERLGQKITPRAPGALLAVLFASLGAMNIQASRHKVFQLAENGRRADRLIAQWQAIQDSLPANCGVARILTDPRPTYSIYVAHDFGLISEGPKVLAVLGKREDLRDTLVVESQWEDLKRSGYRGYRIAGDDRIVPMEPLR